MNETKNYIIVALLVACVAFGWILFRDISDNGKSIQSVRSELDQVRESQQRIIGQLDSISSGLGKSIVRVETVERTVETVADRNTDSTERIDRSKQIISDSKQLLETIRRTGKETEKK